MKIDRSKVLKNIIMISAILFVILGIAIIITDKLFIAGFQYLLTATIYFIALRMIRNGKLKLDSSKDKRSVNLNLGFIFSVVGITSPLGSTMFTMWILGIVLFLTGIFYRPKELKEPQVPNEVKESEEDFKI